MTLDPASFEFRRVKPGDAEPLARFYNSRKAQSVRHFKPLGEQATVDEFIEVIAANSADVGAKFDVIGLNNGAIIGWAFIWKLKTSQPKFGIVVADQFQGQKVGERLMASVMSGARDLGLQQIFLTVVTDNTRAIRLYQNYGFEKEREFLGHQDGQRYYEMIWRSDVC